MRVLLAVLLLGCQGEKVTETRATDAADLDTTTDANPLGVACTPKNNLIINSDFSMGAGGWKNNSFNVTPIDGPCGRALRLTSTAAYPALGQDFMGTTFKKGARYHLRALFRDLGRETGRRPAVIARFFHRDDAGIETYTQTLVAEAYSADGWHLTEVAEPLVRDEERLEVMILLENPAGDSLEVGAVSLATE